MIILHRHFFASGWGFSIIRLCRIPEIGVQNSYGNSAHPIFRQFRLGNSTDGCAEFLKRRVQTFSGNYAHHISGSFRWDLSTHGCSEAGEEVCSLWIESLPNMFLKTS